ncbi:hypothetical protein GCM10009719_05820 [Nocardioides kribbensis]
MDQEIEQHERHDGGQAADGQEPADLGEDPLATLAHGSRLGHDDVGPGSDVLPGPTAVRFRRGPEGPEGPEGPAGLSR